MTGKRYPGIEKAIAVFAAFLALEGFQQLYGIWEENTLFSDSVFCMAVFGAFLFLNLQVCKCQPEKRACLFGLAGGLLFAALTAMGFSLNYTDTIWHGNTFLAVLMLTPFFSGCIMLGLKGIRRKTGTQEEIQVERRWFLLCWLFLFLSWVPVLLASWPGIYSYDCGWQLVSFVDGAVTGHHPILHTYLLGLCMQAGQALSGSNQTGAVFYSLIQMTAMSGMYAYVCRFLKKRQAPGGLQLGSFLFFAFHPVNGLMALCATKDSIFSALFAVFIVNLLEIEEKQELFFSSWRRQAGFCLQVFLLFAFRNNGFHTFLLCIPFLLIFFRNYRKRMGILILICLSLQFVYTGPVYRLLGVEKGDVREMCSVLMQPAARVYNLDYLGLTEEEKEGFLSVIREEGLNSYLSRFADPVKAHFIGEKFAEDPKPFLKAWISAGMRHKRIYVDAFLANTFGYWYPGNSIADTQYGRDYFEYACKEFREDVDVVMESKFPALREVYRKIGNESSFQKIPVVAATFNLGTYTWLLIFAVWFLLYRKRYKGLIGLIPFGAYFLTTLLGPVVKMRYHYPLIAGAPLMLYLIWKYAETEER